MHQLFKSADSGDDEGTPLPPIFSEFSTMKVNFYRSELVMIAGPPGGGKSALALNYAIKAKVPSLYVSCDMPRHLLARRACSILTGDSQEKVKEAQESPEGMDGYITHLSSMDHLYMSYLSRPDSEKIAQQLLAYQEINGLPPDLLIVDNLMNMVGPSQDEYANFRAICQVLHYLATELNICVLVLHHINLGGLDLWYPAPLNAVKGQVTELQGLVLTVASGEGQMRLSPVKNRNGTSDPSGRRFLTLDYDGSTQIIKDREIEEEPIWSTPSTSTRIPDWLERGIKD